jgi:hypothetical protein
MGGFAAVEEETLHTLTQQYIDRYAGRSCRGLTAGPPGSAISSHGCGILPLPSWTRSPGDALLGLRAPGL